MVSSYPKVKVIGRSSAIALMLVFLDWSSAVCQQLSVTARNTIPTRCEPIGRVLSEGDRHFAAGSLICKGDRLQSSTTVDVLCYLNRRILTLASGTVLSEDDRCVPQARKVQPCSTSNRNNCPKPKGPGEGDNNPAIVSPYDNALLNGRPLLSWYAVAGANSYTVQVSGKGVNWQKIVTGNTLVYPDSQPTMQFGNAYRITIVANGGDSPISASSSVFNLLPESEARQVMDYVKRINSLNLPKDEAAYLDLDSIYMAKNLLTETIATLEARVEAGSQNPAIYRVLGDRYLEAGLPDCAKPEYEMATKLAQTSDNLIELAKAQAGLKLVARVSGTITLP